MDAERPKTHSYAERGNEKTSFELTASVEPTDVLTDVPTDVLTDVPIGKADWPSGLPALTEAVRQHE